MGNSEVAVRLPARNLPDAVHLVGEEPDLVGVEGALEVQIAVGLPLAPFGSGQGFHGVVPP